MDGLSAAASGIAVVSLALQLAGGFIKLYDFWGTVQDAPHEVQEVLIDLKLLSKILDVLVKRNDSSPHVKDVLEHCDTKVEVLLSIVREFEPNFSAHSGHVRFWKSFKAARKKQKLKRFRDSLQETKTTLTLALMPHFPMPPAYVEEDITAGLKKSEFTASIEEIVDEDPPDYPKATRTDYNKSADGFSEEDVQASIGNAFQLAAESYFKGGAFEKAMTDTIHRVASIQTTYHYDRDKKETSSDEEDITEAMSRRSSTTDIEVSQAKFQGRRGSQSRICHRTSATGTLFGTIWLRTTSVQVSARSSKNVDIVSSFTFFPSWWLTKVGMNYGMEANLSTTATGWQYNFNPVRAVPDDSPIFNACQRGNFETVRFLLNEGEASVRDTNSRGWTPLHFAAIAESESNIDICELLISEGADKTALAFEGPSENALSPVTIFSATAKRRPADMKIKMLRLFEDCIDMSEPSSEGWTVIEDLVNAFNQESAPVTSNTISWFFQAIKTESMVGFGPKTVWHGLQHALRSFIDMEHHKMVVKTRLNLLSGDDFPASYAMAITYWIVLQVVTKKLLRLLLAAGSILHIEGYDYDHDVEVDPSVLAKQLPFIYDTWCKNFVSSLEQFDEVLNSEFENTLESAGWSQDTFQTLISNGKDYHIPPKPNSRRKCSVCGDCYDMLKLGLVEPRWIAFSECVSLNHTSSCYCQDFLETLGSEYDHFSSEEEGFESGSDIFHDAEDELDDSNQGSEPTERAWMLECEKLVERAESARGKDLFHDLAIQLYRTQARIWLGTYGPGKLFCGTCFLRNEGYIGDDVKHDEGFLASTMPASFNR